VVNALDGGGMERMLLALVRATAGKGWAHSICTLRGPGPLADRVPKSVPLISLDAPDGSRLTPIRLARIIGRVRPDLVHARSWGVWTDAALGNALAGRRPLLLGFHGLDAKSGFSAADRRRAHVLRRLSRRFACVSHAGRDQLAGQLGIPSDQIDLIPNGVDTERFAPPGEKERGACRAALGFAPDAFVLGTVGNLTPVKDHATLLQAIRHCGDAGADVRLLIAGDGPLRSALTRQAEDSGVASQVVFAGSRGDVPALLGAMDVYVCSSLSEGMSNAILEALAVGLPVVATDVGDNRRLVDDGAVGVLVPAADPRALGDAVLGLCRDAARRRAFGRSARARAMACYPFARCVERHVALYRSLASGFS
jgi:glycosyltransferase involved in cell wall biosynthesis